LYDLFLMLTKKLLILITNLRNLPRCLRGLEIKDNWKIYNIFSENLIKGKSQLSLAFIGSILNFYQNEQQANEKYDENIR